MQLRQLCALIRDRPVGTMGHFSTFSFHETKNFTSGEGGALVINQSEHIERAEIIIQKGTNRDKFFRGEVDKYSWVDIGSSYVMNELNAAYLWAQLESCEIINSKRLSLWDRYYNSLNELAVSEKIELPVVPERLPT
jgi:dTDP-4-amino-4,6-dideoxygalactose transaminase